MGKTLIVDNLDPEMDEDGLRAAFSEHGTVARAEIERDPETGASRGIGYVEMATDEEGDAALEALKEKGTDGSVPKITEDSPPNWPVVEKPKPTKRWQE